MLAAVALLAAALLAISTYRARKQTTNFVGAAGGNILHLPAFVRWHYRRPHEVLGLDFDASPQEARDRFVSMFRRRLMASSTSSPGAQEPSLQTLCFAYNLFVLNAKRRVQVQQTEAKPTATVALLEQQTEAARAAAADAQERAARLAQEREKLQHENGRLRAEMSVLADSIKAGQQRLRVLEAYARCAPPYFHSLLQFIGEKCSQGPDLRVSSCDLHHAFVSYLEAHQSPSSAAAIQSPSQRELRALLEQLGFEYAQMQYKGSNARCFKGVALSGS